MSSPTLLGTNIARLLGIAQAMRDYENPRDTDGFMGELHRLIQWMDDLGYDVDDFEARTREHYKTYLQIATLLHGSGIKSVRAVFCTFRTLRNRFARLRTGKETTEDMQVIHQLAASLSMSEEFIEDAA